MIVAPPSPQPRAMVHLGDMQLSWRDTGEAPLVGEPRTAEAQVP